MRTYTAYTFLEESIFLYLKFDRWLKTSILFTASLDSDVRNDKIIIEMYVKLKEYFYINSLLINKLYRMVFFWFNNKIISVKLKIKTK